MRHFYILSILTLLGLSSICQNITSTEAVEYDESQNRFIITNGGSILQQASGSDEFEFFGDSDADYGMEIIGNTLVTISGGFIQSVKFHDLTTEDELNSITIGGSQFLNGMASDPSTNRIWITDFNANNIYEIDVTDVMNPSVETVVSNTMCTPNGITFDGDNNRLVFTCWQGGNINGVDLTDYTVSTLTSTSLQNIDGIDHDENGNFYISSWNPTRITKLSANFTSDETITASGLSNPADISYAVAIDTLAIANSGNQSITYLYFGEPINIVELESDFKLSASPNPISDSSFLEFTLKEGSDCKAVIYDAQGKEVYTILDEHMSSGTHKLLLAGYSFSSGNYICEITTNSGSQTVQLLKE